MKVCVNRMFYVCFAVMILSGCNNGKVKTSTTPAVVSDSSLLTPTKDILVTEGDLNKKYTILGKVEHTMDKGRSVYADGMKAQKEVQEFLKKEAFTKYGDKVDAIINTKVLESVKGGFWGAVGGAYGAHSVGTSAEGIAISFDDKAVEAVDKPTATPIKAKGKRKSRKHRR